MICCTYSLFSFFFDSFILKLLYFSKNGEVLGSRKDFRLNTSQVNQDSCLLLEASAQILSVQINKNNNNINGKWGVTHPVAFWGRIRNFVSFTISNHPKQFRFKVRKRVSYANNKKCLKLNLISSVVSFFFSFSFLSF